MLDLAAKKLVENVGTPVYAKYTFDDDGEDTWPPDIKTLIDDSYWDQNKIKEYLNDHKPEVGKYPVDDDGEPLPFPGENSTPSTSGVGTATAEALHAMAKGNEKGLMALASAFGGSMGGKVAAKQLKATRNDVTIAIAAEVRSCLVSTTVNMYYIYVLTKQSLTCVGTAMLLLHFFLFFTQGPERIYENGHGSSPKALPEVSLL